MKDAVHTLRCGCEAVDVAEVTDGGLGRSQRAGLSGACFVADERPDRDLAPLQFRNDQAGEFAGGSNDQNDGLSAVHRVSPSHACGYEGSVFSTD
jgi:hypothetical protein